MMLSGITTPCAGDMDLSARRSRSSTIEHIRTVVAEKMFASISKPPFLPMDEDEQSQITVEVPTEAMQVPRRRMSAPSLHNLLPGDDKKNKGDRLLVDFPDRKITTSQPEQRSRRSQRLRTIKREKKDKLDDGAKHDRNPRRAKSMKTPLVNDPAMKSKNLPPKSKTLPEEAMRSLSSTWIDFDDGKDRAKMNRSENNVRRRSRSSKPKCNEGTGRRSKSEKRSPQRPASGDSDVDPSRRQRTKSTIRRRLDSKENDKSRTRSKSRSLRVSSGSIPEDQPPKSKTSRSRSTSMRRNKAAASSSELSIELHRVQPPRPDSLHEIVTSTTSRRRRTSIRHTSHPQRPQQPSGVTRLAASHHASTDEAMGSSRRSTAAQTRKESSSNSRLSRSLNRNSQKFNASSGGLTELFQPKSLKLLNESCVF